MCFNKNVCFAKTTVMENVWERYRVFLKTDVLNWKRVFCEIECNWERVFFEKGRVTITGVFKNVLTEIGLSWKRVFQFENVCFPKTGEYTKTCVSTETCVLSKRVNVTSGVFKNVLIEIRCVFRRVYQIDNLCLTITGVHENVCTPKRVFCQNVWTWHWVFLKTGVLNWKRVFCIL